ncbi:MAG TPA: DUF1501 domain-containing protein, partial [Gemmata sp.]|nr:DUF1501 domain-containing protein [Gemmata sp.]
MHRRTFLADLGFGFTGLALSAMLHRDGIARETDARPHSAPKAKRVIWLFFMGGVSHLESFDPKPALAKFAGKTIEESPFKKTVVESPYYRKNVMDFAGTPRALLNKLYPTQVGFRQHGQSGIEVSDWWPHLAKCVDDIAFVRSMWTTDNDHAAQLQFHTGRHVFEGFHPTIGAWVHYALGALSDNLPQFAVLGNPPGDCCGGIGAHGASYLGPEHAGVRLAIDPKNPLPFGTPGNTVAKEAREKELDLLRDLNGLAGIEYPDDPAMRARVKAYELAAKMQLAVPEVMDLSKETAETQKLYGLDNPTTAAYGHMCLVARRMSERGVRFVQVYDGGGGGGGWDAHSKLKDNHAKNSARVDRPIAGLLTDLKRSAMLKDTIVVWATEFGRTPGAENSDGRDHHPYGFTVWMAGGGIKGGVVDGATDEIGFHAVE